METAPSEQLLKAARAAAARRDVTDVLQRIDTALLAEQHGPSQTGRLHLARAIALQSTNDIEGAADQMHTAYALLRKGDEPALAAYAGAAGAVLCHRAGMVERAVELAVSAMVLLGDADTRDENALSATNALAQVFTQLSSPEVSVDLALQAFRRSEHLPMNVRGHYAFNVAQTMIEATLAHPSPKPLWLDHAMEAAEYLSTSPLDSSALIAAAIHGEVYLIRDEQAAYIEIGELLDHLTVADHPIYPGLGERLVAWHRLVRATGAVNWGDPSVGLTLLEQAVPDLELAGDDLRASRALRLSVDARIAQGDHATAARDARRLAHETHQTHTYQIGRLAALIARRAELERSRKELRGRAERLAREVAIDPVTGLQSRRSLERRLDELSDQRGFVGVVMIDIDRFKRVNDRYGHHLGDEVLEHAGALMRGAADAADCARYGGEEFVLLSEASTYDDALQTATILAAKIVEDFRSYGWGELALGLAVTATAGVAAGPAAEVRELVRYSDLALYDGKSGGRDQVVVAAPPAA